jgi:short-subunit dehydrogenase
MEPRNAIVTGASHGIGQYIARALAARHMNLLLVARSEAELARLAGELQTDGSKAAVAAVDLGDPGAARQIAEAAAAELGTVDVLVNNAATEPQTRFHVLTPAEISNVLQVDLTSPLLLARLLLPGMLERRYGRIINISSLAGHTSFPYTEAQAAAKDGLTAFSRVLHSDYRDTGAIHQHHSRWSTPGLVETRFSPDALVWVAVVFHGTAAWRNHGLIIFRFCFIEHLSSCAVQLPRLMAGSARQAPRRGDLGISSSGTRCAPRVPRSGPG